MTVTAPVVLVVDDEAKIRHLVRVYLEREGYVVVEAATAVRAMELVGTADLMILDLGLPDRPGEDVAREVRRDRDMPIIMLTAKAGEAQRIAGLRLGADDYVTKPFSPRELVARVAAVLRRSGTGADPAAAQQPVSFGAGVLRIDGERREVRVDDSVVVLTRTEFDLLTALAGRPGRVWSRPELVARVQGGGGEYGAEYDPADRTVDAHVKNLRRKLGDSPTVPRFVATVAGVGYKLVVDRDG
ncbi:response regulator transcription factor [Rhodococcus antarcticus]|uniref:Response regulator transcription factor n=1 Tax=Rhodococcus antarcticus TaxID=2987751 RepID=A0ABY6P322_9NOCA|nr:response regulator transcription factor [Rhodococcus antarcticus]UZJ26050.1 response regulator transcription factor [Rhodococcus antarcticus]